MRGMEEFGNRQGGDPRLEKALNTLREYVGELALRAGKDEAYAEAFWQEIRGSGGCLRELAYYHDYGGFLCQHRVAGYTLADVLVWQVDHFKLYMDRSEEMNRYRQERLLLAAFEGMLQLEKDPEPLLRKMREESGQDAANG